MGFDPRRWRPSSGSRPLTTNVEALLAENEALRREVRALRLQLEAFLQGEAADVRSWEQPRAASGPNAAAAETRSPWGTEPGAAATGASAPGGPWTSAARSRASRPSWSSAAPPRQRVTVGSGHGLSADLVERWGRALACHPHWQELRIGPPGGLRALEQQLRRHWWNPALSLEQELDRRSPGLGGELSEALRGPHSRVRWAVRAAFALYGPRAPEWLSEEPLRVVEELLRRVQQLERQGGGPQASRRGTRTANHSGAGEDQVASDWTASGRSGSDSTAAGGPEAERHQEGDAAAGGGSRRATDQGGRSTTGQTGSQAPGGHGHSRRRAGGGSTREQGTAGSQRASSRQASPRDRRAQALALLGLESGASAAAIKRAYRRLAKAHHPDLGGDAEAFRRLDAAYRSLL